MSKRMYEDLKEILCHELNEITRKGDIDREGLDDVYKLSSAITMVESLMKKQQGQEEQGQMSNRGGQSNYMPMWSYERGGSNAGGSNASNMSNAYAYDGSNAGGSNRGSNRGGSYEGSYGSYESYEGGSNARGRGRSNESYEGSNNYSEESYRRGRGADGRYVSRDSYDSYENSNERGYSRHTAEQMVVAKLQDILANTKDTHIRKAIMQAMDRIDG